jgi:hypothetical protein
LRSFIIILSVGIIATAATKQLLQSQALHPSQLPHRDWSSNEDADRQQGAWEKVA